MDKDNTSKQGAEGTDNMNDATATPGLSDAEKQPGQEQDKNQQVVTPDPQADKPPRRFLTRTGAARRRASEATLMTSIRQMELNTTWDNVHTHEESVRQMLKALEMDHNEYVVKEKLDINLEPERSYMSEFQGKVDRAIKKHRAKLQFIEEEVREKEHPVLEGNAAERQQHQDEDQIRRLVEGLESHRSASEVGSTSSRLSRGPALMHRIKTLQRRIQAKASAVERVLKHEGIEKNPRAVAKAGVHWSTIEVLRCEYQTALDEACETLGEEALAEVLEEDDKQMDWMVEIEARLEELQILNLSPAKGPDALANKGFINETEKCEKPWEKLGISMAEYTVRTEMANAEHARKWEEAQKESRRKDLDTLKMGEDELNYRKFLQLQTQANIDNEKKL